MAKKELAIRLLVDENSVRFAASQFGCNIQSDKELNETFFERDPLVFDVEVMGEDAFAMTAAFTAFLVADTMENKGE